MCTVDLGFEGGGKETLLYTETAEREKEGDSNFENKIERIRITSSPQGACNLTLAPLLFHLLAQA